MGAIDPAQSGAGTWRRICRRQTEKKKWIIRCPCQLAQRVTCHRSKSATFSQASSVVAGFGRAPDAALFQDPLGAVHIYRRQICQAPTAGAKRMHAMRRQFRSRGSEWGPEESDVRLSMTTIVSHSLWCHSLTLLHSGRNVGHGAAVREGRGGGPARDGLPTHSFYFCSE